jgi:hypothetical protein
VRQAARGEQEETAGEKPEGAHAPQSWAFSRPALKPSLKKMRWPVMKTRGYGTS